MRKIDTIKDSRIMRKLAKAEAERDRNEPVAKIRERSGKEAKAARENRN